MKVIVGLGNPGSEYPQTRHNIGFMAVERLGKQWSISVRKELCSSRVGEGSVGREKVRLVLPQTFMNASGEAVECLMKRWRLGPESLLLVCDDVALPLGSVRIRGQGSDGGHHGLASVFERLGSRQVSRLRVGIGGDASGDLTPFVLGKFTAAEKPALEKGLEQARFACESWIAEGISVTMNRFNRRVTGA